jgi:hypothetical protein
MGTYTYCQRMYYNRCHLIAHKVQLIIIIINIELILTRIDPSGGLGLPDQDQSWFIDIWFRSVVPLR